MMLGSFRMSWSQLLAALSGEGAGELPYQVVWQLRLPRFLGSFACGGLLAISGALMQVLLRNPLADPYILGVSGGASVGALLAILTGWQWFGISSASFLGALGIMALVGLMSRQAVHFDHTRLLLTGVIVASGLSALIALILSLSSGSKLGGMLYWLMGDTALITHYQTPLGAFFLSLLLGALLSSRLNIMLLGTVRAQSLGVNVRHLSFMIYVVASFLTAVSVSTVGPIGFIGLIVPHLVRLIIGNDQRTLLPLVALTGGVLLVVADLFSRLVIAPRHLPVGVLTSLIGVPLFLIILNRSGIRPLSR